MMKIIITAIALLLTVSVSGQKLQLKKDQILVDKVPVFDFIRTQGEGTQSKKEFVLIDMAGDTAVKFLGDEETLVQLPYEERPRFHHYYMIADFRSLGRKERLDYFAVFFKRGIFKELKWQNAVDANGLVEANMEPFFQRMDIDSMQARLDTLSAINSRRPGQYEMCKADFGEFIKRKPGKVGFKDNFVYDGTKKVGYILIKSKSDYGTLYKIRRMAGLKPGAEIGTMFYTPKDGRLYFRYLGEGSPSFDFERFITPGTISDGAKLQIGKILVEEGLL